MGKTLSVVLATFNEEKNLAACLDSVKNLADEIIIVDGSSTDKTVEIAKKYKAKVKITTNKPNFHINKQMAIDMATKDWILQLDADEHVSEQMEKEIKEILKKDKNDINGYWMPRKNLFLGRFLMKGGQYPDYTLRFYRKGKGRLPQKDVHEQAEVEGKVDYLKSALLHYPYENFSHYYRKWDKYNDFFANQIKEEQKSKNILAKLFYAFLYLLVKPTYWFLLTYIRHKGFMDSWQGFVFSLFSALRFPVSYIKYVGPYKFSAAVIVLVAAIIRLYNFPTRWGIGGDDGRDAMIALEAIKRHQLPLVGSFSSAGPFVFGPLFYWFIMLSYIILPGVMNAPWIVLEAVSIINVILLLYLGKILVDKKFSVILGILAAFSPQLVVRSLTLGQHTFVATFSILTIISFILFWQKQKQVFAFLTGLFVGIALSMHYQALNLLVFFPAMFFVLSASIKARIKGFLNLFIGFLIPSLPLLYWDAHQNFANLRNLLDYFLIGEYRLYVPNSWKLFLFKYIPDYWSFVVGNLSFVGLILFFASSLLFAYLFLKRRISQPFSALGIIFFLFLFVNRYYRGERSEGYLLYLLPLVLIFSTLLFYKIISYKNNLIKTLGIVSIIAIIVFNFSYIVKVINFKSPAEYYQLAVKSLISKYPNTKFALYNYGYRFYDSGMGLSFFMSYYNVSDVNGKKIGMSCYGKGCPPQNLTIINKNYVLLVDLAKVKKSDFDKSKKLWINVNQPTVYDDLVGWLNGYNLKSTFFLDKYIMGRLGKI